jgi:non-specific serine/threonine protein kinase
MSENRLDSFADRVWLVDLAPLADPRLLPQVAASALHVHELPGRPPAEPLAEFLRHKHLLLVLDNCEHLVDACAELASALLRSCPDLRILATSREPLGITGETAWGVPSLGVPDPGLVPPVDQLTQCEAVRLFVERATAALPTFSLTERNAPAVAQICHRLDGIPLALELAAARVRLLSAEQLAARLGDRFGLLTGGSRTALPRRQTLRATVDWSYDLLPEAERRVFDRLSVFAGGWSLEAAEAVRAGDGVDAGAVLDLLGRLVDKSLVLAEEQDGAVRHRLLDTLRQYGRECLAMSGGPEAVQRRHSAFFLALAEQAEPELAGAQQGVWLARLEQEHDNLRAVLQWTIERREAELGLRLAGALSQFWSTHGHLSEGRRWLEGLLAVAGNSGAALAVRAKAVSGAGLLAEDQSDYHRGAALWEKGLALFRDLGDKLGTAWSLLHLQGTARIQGEYGRAEALLGEALALFRDVGDKLGTAWSLYNVGLTALSRGEYGRVDAPLEESLALFRDLGDKGGTAWSLGILGLAATHQGEHSRATTLLEESLALFRDLGNKQGSAWSLGGLGLAATHQGEYCRAKALLDESLALFREVADKRAMTRGMEQLATVACAQGEPERAARLFGAAQALREAVGAPRPPADQVWYDRSVAAARASLQERAFAVAWAEGHEMSVEQTLRYALNREKPALSDWLSQRELWIWVPRRAGGSCIGLTDGRGVCQQPHLIA